ncbi:MAG: DUF6326 family protein [Actinomycetota bacterium]
MLERSATEYEDSKVNTKIKLAGAWMALIAFYIYADFLSLYRPGQIDEVRRGVMGPFDVSQATLLVASLIVIIPAVMIVLSLLLTARVNRSLNAVLAILYTLVNISNLVGEEWAFYFLFGTAEIALTVCIFFMARRWPARGIQRDAASPE